MLNRQTKQAVEFWTGQTIELETDERKVYFTELKKVKGNDELILEWPLNEKGVPISVVGQMGVKVHYYDELERELYTFITRMYINVDREIALVYPNPADIKKAQRRRFFRVQTGVEVDLRIPSEEKEGSFETKTLYTLDISGGGLSFLTTEPILKQEEETIGAIHLKSNVIDRAVSFEGKIVSSHLTPRNVYKTAIEFTDIDESDRSDIIKFCMYKQIEQNKLVRN